MEKKDQRKTAIDGKTRTRIFMVFYIISFVTVALVTIFKTIEIIINK